MIFNSFAFVIFLLIVFLSYWLLPLKVRGKNLLLIVASCFFYGWWDWRFLGLLAITVISSYYFGLQIERNEGNRKRQKALSIANIILNVGILGVFKYYDFFAMSFAGLLNLFGLHVDAVTLNLILPIGISFYTFQAIGYSIDVYQRKIAAEHDFVTFTSFVTFFPQLLAGPIERASHMLPQYKQAREFDYSLAVDGCRQMLWGFFKKMVIADHCAAVIDPLWATWSQQSGATMLMCAFFYTIQIYCDFSGYSDISIGVAKLFGIKIRKNFDYPYFSTSIPEFWRRWHISLMQWFRDYIYFPLGGSRCSKVRSIFNSYVVFLVSGLWHGANWTFVFWGGYHATLLAVYKIFNIKTKAEADKRQSLLSVLPKMVLTFVLAMTGWIFFRSNTIADAFGIISRIVTWSAAQVSNSDSGIIYIIASLPILLIVEWIQRRKNHGLEIDDTTLLSRSRVLRWAIYLVILIATVVFRGPSGEFIYFQF